MNDELTKALYTLIGKTEANNKSNDEKFDALFGQVSSMRVEQKQMYEGLREELRAEVRKLDSRINPIEIDRKIVSKMAGVVGFLTSILTSTIIATIARVFW